MKPSILLADDHPLLMQGAKQYLEKLGYRILATAENGNDAYHLILDHKPDIAILDMDMPIMSGIEVAAQVKSNQLDTKIVILTLYKQEAILGELGNKIEGYVTKDTALEELDTCLKEVAAGRIYTSASLKGNITFDVQDEAILRLTPTEVKILRLIKENLTSADIAEQLFISKRTVEKHRSNIVKKLDLGSGHNALFLWLSKNGKDL